jgi:hypothetical protein
MAAQLAEIQWPRARQARDRTKVKQGAGRPVQWIEAAADHKQAPWIVVAATELPRLAVEEETVSATEAFPAAALLVALGRLLAARMESAEAAPGQAVRAVLPAWAVAVGEAVAAEGGGK